ncbi:MAG: hypothetical protein CMD02_08045 [Flavobacteriales bacterium]|nr:hypothetical protein [Flavobacteriales bacterium]
MEFITFYKIRRSLALVFIVGFSFQSNSQKITTFSEEIDIFLTELDVYLNKSQNDELRQISKNISKSFRKFNISVKDQKSIVDISNLMLGAKMKPSPYFRDFFSVVLQISSDPMNKSKLSDWLQVSKNILINSNSKKLLKYCEFTSSFLSNKTLRDSKTLRWTADASSFKFKDEMGTPYVEFNTLLDLNCTNRNGSINIYNTTGKYWIQSHTFQGSKGQVDWRERSWPSDSVYANLSDYYIDVRQTHFKADSVKFFNNTLFSIPIIGQFSNKIVSGSATEHFPVFKSYKKNIVIEDILPNVDYKGGYTLRGREFIADGRKDASAKIIIKKNGKNILVANSSMFSIKKSVIYSSSTSVKIYFDQDSIYHPSLQFTYEQSERKLKLYRDKKGLSGSPIYNSYHQLTMDSELLEWKIDEDNIYLGSLPVASVSTVNFESISSYNDQMYHSLRGIDKVNPLMLIHKFVKRSGKTNFSSSEFAAFAGYPLEQIQPYLMNLANKGFLYYNVATHRATVQEKLKNYVDARLQKGDYDVIIFQSKVSKSGNNMLVNSSLNLNTKDLNILGVNFVSLSDSQKVYIQPYGGKVSVKKNRDFDFSGRISAGRGRFVLYGKDFNFKYDDFKIDLNKIDSVQLAVPIIPIQRDDYGNEKLVRIKTVIQAVTGDLKIDDPNNKSGLKKDSFPEYPIFKSFDDSYVYYDKPSTFGGVYNREKFSFHLDTFEIDSLESFAGKGLRFPGTFESADIFPVFPDTLTMMDDYSLGFIRETPVQGFPLYGGKAKYNNKIYLSNEGLKGDGVLEYLTSSTKSNEIYFFPDSIALFTQEFVLNKVNEGIEFPQVENSETFGLYEPYNERYRVHKLKSDFNFYENQAEFNGNIVLKPTGLTGRGIMNLESSKMESDLFTYNANWFGADTADLSVFTDLGGIAFKSNDLKTHIDLSSRTGDFFSNGKGSFVELPANEYICYIDMLHWDMDKQMLTLGDQDQNSKGSKFISVHPEQDSLSFVAKTSTYNLRDNVINVNGVNDILVADVIIYPSKGFVVEKGAFIPTISDARILANNSTQYHQFTNASVNIDGGKKYTASGDYTYKDDLGEEQRIFFSDISVNDAKSTIGRGEVDNAEPFKIGSKFLFKGTVNLKASHRLLTFDGFFKMNSNCNLIKEEWVAFSSEINPKRIQFKLDSELRNDEGDRLATGILMNLDSTHMYTSFLSLKERPIDVEIISANTYLSYDKRTSSFIIQGEDSISNIFTLNENNCKSQAEGVMDINLDYGQLKVKSIGFADRDEKNNKTEFQMFLMLDFMFNKEALSIMAENIFEAYGVTDFTFGEFYSRTLARLVGKSRSEELIIDIEALDEFKDFPNELNKTLCFTDITLVWSDKHQAYINKGKIGVGNIYDRQLNSVMDGWVRLSKKNGNDVLNILLKTEYGDVYFFEYKNNVMFSYSTNDDYNNILINMKAKNRRADEGKGKPPYRYVYCSEDKMEQFDREIRKID